MQPVKSHSGDDAIAAFKECEFRVSMMFPPGEFKLARVHSDCEKSLIGPLCDMLKARGIWPTNTEGYDHNGNAVVENRNRTLQQGRALAIPQYFSHSNKGLSDYFSNSLSNSQIGTT